MTDAILITAAYLLGSISSAIIVCKVISLPDPRTLGSNNPGATNVLRLGGKKAAALTLIGDMLKGFVPVFAAKLLSVTPLILALVSIAAFLGHLFPIFFGFRGGKGVATALGVQFGLSWWIGGTIALIWLFMAKVGNISSLAALISMALAPVIVWYFWPAPALILMQLVMSLILFWRHRANIRDLLSGAESKIKDEQEPSN